jgi:tRNA(Ile)-lysidine synthase
MAWWLRHFPDRQLPGAPLDGLVAALAAQVGAGAWSVGNGLALRLDDAGQLTCGAEAPASPPARAAGASWHWAAGPVFLPDGARLRARRVEWAADAVPPCTAADPRTTAWLAQPPAVLRVRQWLPGDRYRPLGAPGRRKLQDLFTDARVDPADRHRLPVIADAENAILWVPGFAPAESQRVAHGRISALKLTYHVH